MGRAAAYAAKGNYQLAFVDANEGIRLNPHHSIGYANRGIAYAGKGDYDLAIKDYSEAIRLDPRGAWLYANRGEAYGYKGDYDRAITDLNEAIRLSPIIAFAFSTRGDVYRKKREYGRALVDHDRAVKLDANSVEVYFNRGRTYEAKGEKEKAAEDYKRALAMLPKTAWQIAQQDKARERLSALQAAPPPRPAASKSSVSIGRRIALVIGNGSYRVGPLQNPGNDAAAVATTLRDILKFDKVIFRRDLVAESFRAALREFSRETVGADLGMVYFAGHGTEVGGRNYLIPVDAALTKASDLELETVALDAVLAQLDGVRKLRLVILDACRNNAFPLAGATRRTGRGLSRIEPDENTLVIYAAKDGTTADDGVGGAHSPFTAALLKHIATPGLELRFLFGKVRDDVLVATRRAQQPYVYGTLGGEPVFLRP
jgi:tetratricopeptide (TPR) repeat protein